MAEQTHAHDSREIEDAVYCTVVPFLLNDALLQRRTLRLDDAEYSPNITTAIAETESISQ